jgi:hypothetical protein
MEIRGQKNLIVLCLFLLMITAIGCGQPSRSRPDVEPNFDGTGTMFIWAIANDDEEQAMSTLSTSAQSAVAKYCQDGKVIACFNGLGILDWGRLEVEDIVFLRTYVAESKAPYMITWGTNRVVWIVLEIVKENSAWRVDGWRGWIVADAGPPDGLIDGSDTTNLFPPKE